ncbi:MAG: glycosyltransferase family 2 protein [Candidatus Omnitrophica bacterium]|nr:glycosyltransferase family 2 protein [Candidatus Omnitrophota bacterium]MDD5671194.1 glycosyltransferase family 2 protein [Candidatus Omnitrophota bacterium]
MNERPKLSIITTVLNGERFMAGCLRNVIDQRCDGLEHLVVDGASTDHTVDIVKQFAGRYAHIRWISEKDKGQNHAMNKGLRLAQGTIVGFLNVDDFYEPGVLNRILKIFEPLEEPVFLAGNCNVWNDEGRIRSVCRPNRLKFKDLLLGYEICPHPVNPSSYFYHLSLHEKAGWYDEDNVCNGDLDFILRAVRYARVMYRDELWGNFRCIQGTKTYRNMITTGTQVFDRPILERYRRMLPFVQRIHVYTVLTIYRIRFAFFAVIKNVLRAAVSLGRSRKECSGGSGFFFHKRHRAWP